MKKDLIERLRESLNTERELAEAVVDYPVEATDAPYREAKAETDKLLAKLEKRMKRAAWWEGDVPVPRTKEGGPAIPPIPPATGGVIPNVPGSRIIVNVDPHRPLPVQGQLDAIGRVVYRGVSDR